MLKIAALAPMPSASVVMTVSERPRARDSDRAAIFKSLRKVIVETSLRTKDTASLRRGYAFFVIVTWHDAGIQHRAACGACWCEDRVHCRLNELLRWAPLVLGRCRGARRLAGCGTRFYQPLQWQRLDRMEDLRPTGLLRCRRRRDCHEGADGPLLLRRQVPQSQLSEFRAESGRHDARRREWRHLRAD